MSTGILSTGTPAQIATALLGAKPTVDDLRRELDDLEGMNDAEAAYLFGSLARKNAFERLIFRRFYAANTRKAAR